MAPEDTTALSPEPQKMSEISRLAGVVFEPGKTFEDEAQRPTWLVPLLLVMVVNCIYIGLFSEHVGWERLTRQENESSPRGRQMDPAVGEQAIRTQTKTAPVFGYVGAIIGTPLIF